MNNLISPHDLHREQESGSPPRIIDVRGAEDYADGHIPGAENVPADELERELGRIPKDKAIVVY